MAVGASPVGNPTVGDRLAGYELEELLGQGATGVVYRARRTGRPGSVALKLLRAELVDDPVDLERFIREAALARGFEHPNLVEILDAGVADRRPYIAMTYVEGLSLDARLRGRGALPAADAVALVEEIAAGLDVLHRNGIVHRDVKPGNILLARDGRAVLTDLGLAKAKSLAVLTHAGTPLGTVGYMAPEVIRGESATRSSDVYALGCVAVEAFTGRPPFEGSRLEIAVAHLDATPPEAGRPAVARVIRWALEKEPAARPDSAGAFGDALRSAAGV